MASSAHTVLLCRDTESVCNVVKRSQVLWDGLNGVKRAVR